MPADKPDTRNDGTLSLSTCKDTTEPSWLRAGWASAEDRAAYMRDYMREYRRGLRRRKNKSQTVTR